MNIAWTEEMATGVSTVDAQHKQLIQQLNALLAAMGQGQGKQEIGRILDYLAEYTSKHFRHEEECMQRYRCPAAGVNQQAHAKFMATFLSLRERYQADGVSVALVLAVQRELSDWLMAHIKGVDSGLKTCVRAPVAQA